MQLQPRSPVWAPSLPGFPTPAECGLTPFREVWHGAGTFPHSSPTTKAHRLLFALPRPPRCFTIHSPLRGFCLLCQNREHRGDRGGERGGLLDGRPHYLSPSNHWGTLAVTMSQRGCDVTSSPEMVLRGQVQGPVAWSVAGGLLCSGGRLQGFMPCQQAWWLCGLVDGKLIYSEHMGTSAEHHYLWRALIDSKGWEFLNFCKAAKYINVNRVFTNTYNYSTPITIIIIKKCLISILIYYIQL